MMIQFSGFVATLVGLLGLAQAVFNFQLNGTWSFGVLLAGITLYFIGCFQQEDESGIDKEQNISVTERR